MKPDDSRFKIQDSRKHRGQQGQSLVEVLIAILVVTLVLTTVVVAVVAAIRSAKFAQHKSRATFLSQEALEWIRGLRQELGWGDFSGLATYGGEIYCLQVLEFTDLGECSAGEEIDGLYKRSAELILDTGEEKITIEVRVKWREGSKEFDSQVSTAFEKWNFIDD